MGCAWNCPGPVGEQNTYRLLPRGDVLCVAATRSRRAAADRRGAGHRQSRAGRLCGGRCRAGPAAARAAVRMWSVPNRTARSAGRGVVRGRCGRFAPAERAVLPNATGRSCRYLPRRATKRRRDVSAGIPDGRAVDQREHRRSRRQRQPDDDRMNAATASEPARSKTPPPSPCGLGPRRRVKRLASEAGGRSIPVRTALAIRPPSASGIVRIFVRSTAATIHIRTIGRNA